MPLIFLTAFVVSTMQMARSIQAQTIDDQERVRQTVRSFYDDVSSHRWEHATNYTTEDWEQHIRTFVVVKGAGRWLITQDQNTAVLT